MPGERRAAERHDPQRRGVVARRASSAGRSRMRWSITGTTTSTVARWRRCRRARPRGRSAGGARPSSRAPGRCARWAKPHVWKSGAAMHGALARLRNGIRSSIAAARVSAAVCARGALRGAGRAGRQDECGRAARAARGGVAASPRRSARRGWGRRLGRSSSSARPTNARGLAKASPRRAR